MPTNYNPTPSQDVAPEKTNLIPTAIALVIALVIGVIGYSYFFSDSTSSDSINKSETKSITLPTSGNQYDTNERQEASDRNLSSSPPQNPSTNNKPFEGDKKTNSSGPNTPN